MRALLHQAQLACVCCGGKLLPFRLRGFGFLAAFYCLVAWLSRASRAFEHAETPCMAARVGSAGFTLDWPSNPSQSVSCSPGASNIAERGLGALSKSADAGLRGKDFAMAHPRTDCPGTPLTLTPRPPRAPWPPCPHNNPHQRATTTDHHCPPPAHHSVLNP